MKIINFFLFSFLFFLLLSCSFDYGNQESGDSFHPDIVMNDVEYVRVRSSDLYARFLAERVERYEERRIMELRNFSFEQFGNNGEEINAVGRAGNATIEMDTLDVFMENGVRIEVESEDIAIETSWFQWRDRIKTLTGGETEKVSIFQGNGAFITGIGFRADTRQRTWEFSGFVEGTFIHEEEEEEEFDIEENAIEETPLAEDGAL